MSSYIPEYIKEYLDRFPETNGASLAKALHIPGRSARRYVRNYKREYSVDYTVDERREALHEYFGTSFKANPLKDEKKDIRTVLALGDFHGLPDRNVLAKVRDYKPDIVVWGGDIFDQISASRWPSETKRQAKRRAAQKGHDELKEMRTTLELFIEWFNAPVYLMLGNHDIRSVRMLLESMPEWILEYYRDPIEMLCDGLENRAILVNQEVAYTFPNGQVYHTDMSNEFVFVLGDVLFSHMNFTSSVTESAVSKLHRNWFMHWERPLGLKHVNLLVQFHSHQRNMLSLSGGHLLLIEPGMSGSVDTEEYKFGYNGKWKPSSHGFLVLDQVKVDGYWCTIPDSIELVAPYLTRG